MLNDVLVFQRFEKEQSTQLTSLWDEYLRLPSRFLKLKNQEYYLPVENRVTFVTKCVRFCTSMLVYGFSIIIMISPTASRSLLRRCFCLNIWHFSKICQFWQTKLKNPKKCCMIRVLEPRFELISGQGTGPRAHIVTFVVSRLQTAAWALLTESRTTGPTSGTKSCRLFGGSKCVSRFEFPPDSYFSS